MISTVTLVCITSSVITADIDDLQGHWVMVSSEVGQRAVSEESIKASGFSFTIKGDQWIVANPMNLNREIRSTFKIDDTKEPKTLDRMSPDGKVTLSIYKLENGTLTLCTYRDSRPTEFKTKVGDGVLAVYKLDKSKTP